MLGLSCLELLGVLTIGYLLWKFGLNLVLHDLYVLYWGRTDVRQRLSRLGSWVVITGATGGLGLQWTHLMAKWKFNLVLLGIPDNALEALATEIRERYNVKVEAAHVDFRAHEPSQYEPLVKAVRGKDVAILFNNAGVINDYPEYFDKVSTKMLTTLIDVNCKALTLVMQIVLQESMIPRQKGIVLNMSSYSCVHGAPFLSVYAASKSYVRSLTEQLAQEYQYLLPNVHFQYFTPMFICTDMTKYSSEINTPSLTNPLPATFVESAKHTLGLSLQTMGYLPHTLASWFGAIMPHGLSQRIMFSFMDHYRKTAINRPS
jgi:17beta-estradiol 17-dehydrogenase / very-long-chain 3-oxoacyl-CoA reductase